eukprot:4192374-Pyramimonas_sp.AAC.1
MSKFVYFAQMEAGERALVRRVEEVERAVATTWTEALEANQTTAKGQLAECQERMLDRLRQSEADLRGHVDNKEKVRIETHNRRLLVPVHMIRAISLSNTTSKNRCFMGRLWVQHNDFGPTQQRHKGAENPPVNTGVITK